MVPSYRDRRLLKRGTGSEASMQSVRGPMRSCLYGRMDGSPCRRSEARGARTKPVKGGSAEPVRTVDDVAGGGFLDEAARMTEQPFAAKGGRARSPRGIGGGVQGGRRRGELRAEAQAPSRRRIAVEGAIQHLQRWRTTWRRRGSSSVAQRAVPTELEHSRNLLDASIEPNPRTQNT